MSDKYLIAEQVIDVIKDLAQSQGFYERVYNNILDLQANKPEDFETLKTGLELMKFKDPVDVVIAFES